MKNEEKSSGLSRRDFAKAGAAAGAFAILSSKGAKAANSDTLRVGLLGCGGRGTGAALNMLQGQNNIQLVAMADLFEDRLESSKRRIENTKAEGIPEQVNIDPDLCFTGFDAYEKILATDIDIVIEGSLPYSRPKHLLAAANAGKHIFSEKPFAVDPVGVRTVLEAARIHKGKGLSWVSGPQRRHQPVYQETIGKIHDGAIGDVRAMRVFWCGTLPFVRDRKDGQSDFEYRVRNWINNCWTSGDNIVEQHVHNLDVARWVLGDAVPEKVYATGGRVWKPKIERYGDMFDHFDCDYEFAGGVRVFSMSRHWDGTDERVWEEAIGTTGNSSCTDMFTGGEKGDPYVIEHQDLCKSIRDEGPKWHQGEETAHSTLMAIMGRMSAYEGREITWEEALNSDLSIVPENWNFEDEVPVPDVPNPVTPRA